MMFTRRMLLKIAAVALLHPALRWTAPEPDPLVVHYVASAPERMTATKILKDREDWMRQWSEISKMTIPELRAAGLFLA